ncbi:helix-turn-helix domain-containing protein [soil metagenome]
MKKSIDATVRAAEALEVKQSCLLTRTRLIARIVTNLYDEALRPFGINSPQYALLGLIEEVEPATRADLARHNSQDRSTLSRNLQIMLDEGWIEETAAGAKGRSRPLILSRRGCELLHAAMPAWRAGQLQAQALMGKEGVDALIQVADGMAAA